MIVQPYLLFNGRCEEALSFYGEKLGAEVVFQMRFKDGPPNPEHPLKPGTEDNGLTAVTGINPNDVLANSSFERLQDKAQVKVTNTPIPGSANSENNAP